MRTKKNMLIFRLNSLEKLTSILKGFQGKICFLSIIMPVIFIVVAGEGCKKIIQVDTPKTSINSLNVYEQDVTAVSVLTGIYTNLSKRDVSSPGGMTSISFFSGLSADELSLTIYGITNQIYNSYYTNRLNSQYAGYEFWNDSYANLYIINDVLEGVFKSTTLTPSVKQQIIGEAKFLRAFYFFYLVNLYGDVPLTLSTDYKVNSLMPRTPKELVWGQIISDLKDAEAMLRSEYLDASLMKSTLERVRPTKAAATAMLARAYLYTRDWQNAEEKSSEIIDNENYRLENFNNVFKKNNNEAIWQLQPVTMYYNTMEAIAFIINPEVGVGPIVLNPSLLDCFEPGDLRKDNWIKSIDFLGGTFSFAYKYKIPQDINAPVSEYSTVLRLAEQYLIRAEARIQLSKISDGIADLNVLRDRATDKSPGAVHLNQLPNSISYSDAINAVEHERRVELFTEWGHRWLDLKRTGRVDNVMTLEVAKKIPGGIWKSYQQLYPISLYELQHNPKMIQNNGY